ncbi:hypothetical protein B566_EDAN012082 [Ephemera danica]|nr:hypothetical protein B566_EDAN012082 [Ephemera danica]
MRTHGFVVDKNGLKMSKCWVATQAIAATNIPASPGTFKAASEVVSRLRTIARFLLGSVQGPVDFSQDTSAWRFMDRLMLHNLYSFHVQPELLGVWEQLQPLRTMVFSEADSANTQQFGATLEIPMQLYTILKPVAEEEPMGVDVWKSPRSRCLRCRRHTALPGDELCQRCQPICSKL